MKRILTSLLLLLCASSLMPLHAEPSEGVWGAGLKLLQAYTLTDEEVEAYMRDYMKMHDRQNTILGPSTKYGSRLARLTSGFKKAGGVTLNFKVYKKNELNAFASADGSVRVYSKLMDVMTDDELLGIIGHEIGHVAHKDSRKAFKQALLTSAVREGLAEGDNWLGALSRSVLGGLGETLVNAKYSRTQESSADDYGYTFLKKHGKSPWALAKAFKKMKQLQKQGSLPMATLTRMFSSHPDLDKRIATIEARCKRDGIPKPAGY